MNKRRKLFTLYIVNCTLCIVLAGCFSGFEMPEENATVTLYLSAESGGRSIVPPNKVMDHLVYEISFSLKDADSLSNEFTTSPGQTQISMSLPPGEYFLNIYAYLYGEVIGYNTNNPDSPVEIKSGVNRITANMEMLEEIVFVEGIENVETLTEKFEWVNNQEEENKTYIILAEDNKNLSATEISTANTVVLIGIGNERKITLAGLNQEGYWSMFYVGEGSALTLRNISLVGNSQSSDALISVWGKLCLQDGAAITGNASMETGGGVAVYRGGVFEMYGGTISGNSASYGGGVYVGDEGDFRMYGGLIGSNTAENGGDNLYLGFYEQGYFTMYGGTIRGGIYAYAVESEADEVIKIIENDVTASLENPVYFNLNENGLFANGPWVELEDEDEDPGQFKIIWNIDDKLSGCLYTDQDESKITYSIKGIEYDSIEWHIFGVHFQEFDDLNEITLDIFNGLTVIVIVYIDDVPFSATATVSEL